MNKRFRAALLIAVLTLSLLAGCTAQAAGNSNAAPLSQNPSVQTNPPATQAAAPGNRLTEEEVKAIALAHAGFTTDQVRFLKVEPELRDRIPHFDVEFQEGRWEYEYEIHAETGKILSFEKDD